MRRADDGETFLVSSGRRIALSLSLLVSIAACSVCLPTPAKLNADARHTISERASDLAEFQDYLESFNANLLAVSHPTSTSELRRYAVDGLSSTLLVDERGCKLSVYLSRK